MNEWPKYWIGSNEWTKIFNEQKKPGACIKKYDKSDLVHWQQ